MWASKNTSYFEGESSYTYETAKGHFYNVTRSQPHVIYSQCFFVAGIISPHFREKEEVEFRKASPDSRGLLSTQKGEGSCLPAHDGVITSAYFSDPSKFFWFTTC